jgi:hypothetical protein
LLQVAQHQTTVDFTDEHFHYPQAPVIWIYPPKYRDFILVFPVESGVRPLYVCGGGSVRTGDHKAPDIEQITGFENLKKAKPKTPRQGGAGLRERWVDEKGRRLYEWDSQHGELEIYLASDGNHIGAFSHISGEQLKPANKKRNIKKYL